MRAEMARQVDSVVGNKEKKSVFRCSPLPFVGPTKSLSISFVTDS